MQLNELHAFAFRSWRDWGNVFGILPNVSIRWSTYVFCKLPSVTLRLKSEVMMTREEFAEIMNYCKEHKMPYKSRLEELNIPLWRFYDSKSRYAAEQSSGKTYPGEFIELPHSRSFVSVPSFAGTGRRKQKHTTISPTGLKEIEIRNRPVVPYASVVS